MTSTFDRRLRLWNAGCASRAAALTETASGRSHVVYGREGRP